MRAREKFFNGGPVGCAHFFGAHNEKMEAKPRLPLGLCTILIGYDELCNEAETLCSEGKIAGFFSCSSCCMLASWRDVKWALERNEPDPFTRPGKWCLLIQGCATWLLPVTTGFKLADKVEEWRKEKEVLLVVGNPDDIYDELANDITMACKQASVEKEDVEKLFELLRDNSRSSSKSGLCWAKTHV